MELRPGYKTTEVGVIPKDWDAKAIGGYIDLLTGFPFPSAGYTASGVRLMRGSNVKRGETDWAEEMTQYWPTITPDVARYELRAGDLVIAMDGSLVGRSSAQLTTNDIPALLLQRVARLRSTKYLDAAYVAAFVGSDWFAKHSDAVKTVTAIPHISPADIRNFRIPIPPTIDEQRAIAGTLSDVDALVAKLDQVIAKKRDLKRATMQQLLTGKTRLPRFGGEWEVKRLSELGTFSKGKGVRKDEVVSEGLPCVRYGEIYTHHHDHVKSVHSYITPTTAKESQRIKKGDLLFAASGETAEEIGKCVAFLNDEEAYAGGDIIIHTPIGQNSMFLGYLMNHPIIAAQKARMGQGDAVVHISAKNLGTLELRLPKCEEQAAIAAVLCDIDTEMAAIESRRDKTRAVKQGMMQELLTGKIRLI